MTWLSLCGFEYDKGNPIAHLALRISRLNVSQFVVEFARCSVD
jgi:hypothetical protein